MRLLALVFLLFLCTLFSPQAKGYNIDSLKRVAERSNNDTARFNALFKLGIAHIDTAYDVSIGYWEQALNLAISARYWKLAADAHHQLGYMQQKKGNLHSSQEHLQAALSIYEQLNLKDLQAELFNDMGLNFRTWAQYDLALDNFMQALELFKLSNNTEGVGMVSNNIGQIFFHRQNYLKAIEFFNVYLEINKANGYARAVAAASNNIASSYMAMNSFDLAHNYFTKSLHIYDSLGIEIGVAILQDNIGSLLLKRGQYMDALLYHTHALERFQNLGSKANECAALKNIGLVHLKSGNLISATEYLTKALQYAEEENIVETKMEVYYNLAQVHQQSKNFPKAIDFYKLHYELRDSILKAETDEKLKKIEMLLSNETQNTELTESKRKLQKLGLFNNLLLISTITMLLSASLFMFLANRKRKSITIAENNSSSAHFSFKGPSYTQVTNEALLRRLLPKAQIFKSRTWNIIPYDTIIIETEKEFGFLIYHNPESSNKNNKQPQINQLIYERLSNDSNISTHFFNRVQTIFQGFEGGSVVYPKTLFKGIVYESKTENFRYIGNSGSLMFVEPGDIIKIANGYSATFGKGITTIACNFLNGLPSPDLDNKLAMALEALPIKNGSEIEQILNSWIDFNESLYGTAFSSYMLVVGL